MKKTSPIIFVLSSLVMILFCSVVSFASNDSGVMKFTEGSCSLITGDTYTIYLTGDSNNAFGWTSSDTSIINIDSSNTRSAKIRATGTGNATITAVDDNGLKAECQINVSLRELILTESDITIELEDSHYLALTVNYSVTWASDNPDIASVYEYYDSSTGKRYVRVYGDGLGTTTVRATDKYGATVSCSVTVLESHLELKEYTISLEPKQSATIDVIGGKVANVESSDMSIAQADFDLTSVTIYAASAVGNAQIIVTGKRGAQKFINVEVSKDFRIGIDSITVDMDYEKYYRLGSGYSYDYQGVPQYVVKSINSFDLVYDKIITAYSNNRIERNITVKSLNPDIVDVNYRSELLPVAIGTATIECEDPYGQKATFKVVVPEAFIKSYIAYATVIKDIKIGNTSISGKTVPGADIKIKIGNKQYNGTANVDGQFKIKVPDISAKTVKLTISYDGAIYTISKKTSRIKPKISFPTVYTTTRKLKVTVRNVIKGDKVKITVGKKTYTKKVKKNSKKKSYTIKIKKQKVGTKIKVKVIDNKKTCLNTKSAKVKKKPSNAGETVYWTTSGSVYHKRRNCPTLKNSKNIKSGTIKQSGKKRCCKVCG